MSRNVGDLRLRGGHRRSVCRALASLTVLLFLTVTPLAAQEPEGEGSTGKAWLSGGPGTGTEEFAAVSAELGVKGGLALTLELGVLR